MKVGERLYTCDDDSTPHHHANSLSHLVIDLLQPTLDPFNFFPVDLRLWKEHA